MFEIYRRCLVCLLACSLGCVQQVFAGEEQDQWCTALIDEEIKASLFPREVDDHRNYITLDSIGGPSELGQMGNQCFRTAVGVSYALKMGYYFALPARIKGLYPEVFHRVPVVERSQQIPKNVYFKVCNKYPVLTGSTLITGHPWSTKYFSEHASIIRELFKPKPETEARLKKKYDFIFRNPKKYVGLHIRTFVTKSDSKYLTDRKCMLPIWGTSPTYFRRAISHFDYDTIFIVFSDNIYAAEKLLAEFDRKFIFSDGSATDDFYMLSMLQNVIISNSTFSAFAAYLNADPNQVVVMPRKVPWLDMRNKWIRKNYYSNPNRVNKEYAPWQAICLEQAKIQGFVAR